MRRAHESRALTAPEWVSPANRTLRQRSAPPVPPRSEVDRSGPTVLQGTTGEKQAPFEGHILLSLLDLLPRLRRPTSETPDRQRLPRGRRRSSLVEGRSRRERRRIHRAGSDAPAQLPPTDNQCDAPNGHGGPRRRASLHELLLVLHLGRSRAAGGSAVHEGVRRTQCDALDVAQVHFYSRGRPPMAVSDSRYGVATLPVLEFHGHWAMKQHAVPVIRNHAEGVGPQAERAG